MFVIWQIVQKGLWFCAHPSAIPFYFPNRFTELNNWIEKEEQEKEEQEKQEQEKQEQEQEKEEHLSAQNVKSMHYTEYSSSQMQYIYKL